MDAGKRGAGMMNRWLTHSLLWMAVGLAALSGSCSPGPREPELIPLEIIFGNPEKTSPRISPDGTRLSYLAPVDNVLNIWVGTIGGSDVQPVTKDTLRGIRYYFWAEDAGPDGQPRRTFSDMYFAEVRPFGTYEGKQIGFQGRLETPIPLQDALAACAEHIGPPKTLLQFGPERIRRLGIVSGSASDPVLLEEASHGGIDLLITGEPKQAAYYLAQEYGLNIFYGGHYRTETFGVKALGEHLAVRFGLPTEFIETACPF